MTFPSFCVVHADTIRYHLYSIEQDILRHRIPAPTPESEHIGCTSTRTLGQSARKPSLEVYDSRGRRYRRSYRRVAASLQ